MTVHVTRLRWDSNSLYMVRAIECIDGLISDPGNKLSC
jgi:hypothetical protein